MNSYRKLNWTLIICYLLLILFGWLNIYASSYTEETASIFSLANKGGTQLIWMGGGILVAIFILFVISPKLYSASAIPFYILITILLVAVLIIGKEINGAKAWIDIGPMNIQPSEFSKISTALLLSTIMSQHNFKMSSKKEFLKAVMVVLIPILLIAMQPDVGTILVYFGLIFVFYREGLSGWFLCWIGIAVILFLLTLKYSPSVSLLVAVGIIGVMRTSFSRRPMKMILSYLVFIIIAAFVPLILQIPQISELNPLEPHYWLSIMILTPAIIVSRREYKRKNKYFFPIFISFVISLIIIFSVDFVFDNILQPHHRDRIEHLLGISEDLQGAGYNVNQSKIAIGSGGFIGKGFLQGTQTKFNFVPEQSTDFIFCTIGEEWGFVGAVAVIGVFFTIILNILLTAERQKDKFTRVFGYCIASYLFIHVFINIGMTIGIMPVVGIPLPLISYGGSSFMTFTVLLFIYIRLDFDRWN